jgi:hypothetical protein
LKAPNRGDKLQQRNPENFLAELYDTFIISTSAQINSVENGKLLAKNQKEPLAKLKQSQRKEIKSPCGFTILQDKTFGRLGINSNV